MVTWQKLGNTPIAPNKELIRNIYDLSINSSGVFYDGSESGKFIVLMLRTRSRIYDLLITSSGVFCDVDSEKVGKSQNVWKK